ncbi:MAG: ribbon-helix-helix domain-containing protein [Promicromonosporaceae bacterium]|nr:ribbon-helix-helix domain-containing protein [Promicromonosporaceae bacterium]
MAVLTRPVSVRFTEDMAQRVAALAATARRSAGDIVREGMERQIEQLEWEYRVAEQARAIRSGRVVARPLDDLVAELNFTEAEIAAAPADDDMVSG